MTLPGWWFFGGVWVQRDFHGCTLTLTPTPRWSPTQWACEVKGAAQQHDHRLPNNGSTDDLLRAATWCRDTATKMETT